MLRGASRGGGAPLGRSIARDLSWFPHGLTLSRLGLTGLGYWAITQPDRTLFTGLVLAAVVTDILDGPVARYLDAVSRFGSNLDTAVDVVFYGSLVVWVYLAEPDIALFRSLLPLVYAVAILQFASMGYGWWRRGVLGFHSPFTRASCTAGVLATLWTVLFGFHILLAYGLLVILVMDIAHRFGVTQGWFEDKLSEQIGEAPEGE